MTLEVFLKISNYNANEYLYKFFFMFFVFLRYNTTMTQKILIFLLFISKNKSNIKKCVFIP